MKNFKPLLACEADLSKLRFPLLASPKLDGIRCVVHPELGPVTRNLKPIRNKALRERLAELPAWLDGELVAGSPEEPGAMQRTTSAVMSEDNDSSDVTFWVFDRVRRPEMLDLPPEWFQHRFDRLAILERYGVWTDPRVVVLPHSAISSLDELSVLEEQLVEIGFEGVMLRDPRGVYKFGRSTVKEGILLKLKRFSDMEGRVVGVVEQMSNQNEQTRDALGRAKRSTSKEGKVPTGKLGALELEIEGWPESTVEVGGGFTDEQRQQLWRDRDTLPGKLVTFKYQAAGSKDRPRFPVFKCFRGEE